MSTKPVYRKLRGIWVLLIFLSLTDGLTWTSPQMNSSSTAINITWSISLEPDEYFRGITWQKNGKTMATYNFHDKFEVEPKYTSRLHQHGKYGLSLQYPTSEDNGGYTASVVILKDGYIHVHDDPHVFGLFVIDKIQTVEPDKNYLHGSQSSSLCKSQHLVTLLIAICILITKVREY